MRAVFINEFTAASRSPLTPNGGEGFGKTQFELCTFLAHLAELVLSLQNAFPSFPMQLSKEFYQNIRDLHAKVAASLQRLVVAYSGIS